METYQHWISGEQHAPVGGEWMETFDPYDGLAWARIAQGSADDVDAAVHSAREAMYSGPWSRLTATERGHALRRIGDALSDPVQADRLAALECRDNGKLLAETQSVLRSLPQIWYYYAGLADKIQGAVLPEDRPDMLAMTYREPVGVVAALTSWNSPLTFFSAKCAPALAAGCTVVLKPSEFASVTSLELAAMTKAAGLPDGVINVVTGTGPDIGPPLVEHPDVSMITFTGSDQTGARVYEAAARQMKRVAMELGGKSPNIVFEDAHLDAAVVGAVRGVFAASGQMCTSGSRLLVQESIRAEFTNRLLDATSDITLGDPKDPNTHVGPIATRPQFEKVIDYLEVAKREGARCIRGGHRASNPSLAGGQFVEPTIFADVRNSMRIAQEEVFGPVLSIIGFEDEAEAVEVANDVTFGLAAGVWTQDLARAVRMSRALRAGVVWVNTYRVYSNTAPVGGVKRSGLGREYGIEGIEEYLETKTVMISTASASQSTVDPFVLR